MLKIVSTPIGNLRDISLRALDALRDCDYVVGEEYRVASTLLKRLEIHDKEILELNEHSRKDDIYEIVDLCKTQTICLISDCGTPVFADPGAQLIAACRSKNIAITSLPGASSLMTLLSLSSKPLEQFVFKGFLPVKKDERLAAIHDLKKESRHQIIMDTPYRLQSLITDLAAVLPKVKALLALNLTLENELILEGTFTELKSRCNLKEAEFIILIYG